MKYLFILLVFIFNNCQSQEHKKELIYNIEKSIVESVDKNNFEIVLNKHGIELLSKLDFSQYNFITIDSCEIKIPIIPHTMSFKPPNIFIYAKESSIVLDTKIQLQTKHLNEDGGNLKQLLKALERLK